MVRHREASSRARGVLRRRSLCGLPLIVALLFSAPASGAAQERLLPGEAMWQGTTPSFIFGTNDGIEYGSPNVDTLPKVQADTQLPT